MGKVIYIEKTEKGDVLHIAGKVSNLKERSLPDGSPVVGCTVTVSRYNKEKKTTEKQYYLVSFFDTTMERAKKALHAGSFVSLTCVNAREMDPAKDGTPTCGVKCINFTYANCQTFKNEDGSEKCNLITGTVGSVTEQGNGKVRVSVAVNDKRKEAPTWYSIFAADTERAKNATRAKHIAKGDHICVLTGAVRREERGNSAAMFDFENMHKVVATAE